MAIQNLDAWTTELIETGNIVQDADMSVSSEEAERRFNRYAELVDGVEGNEGPEAVRALVRSIQVRYDYGAYQRTVNAVLGKFPVEVMMPMLLSELPDLIRRQPEWAGDIVNQIAHQHKAASKIMVTTFNSEVKKLPPQSRQSVEEFIRQEESEGWLEKLKGILCP